MRNLTTFLLKVSVIMMTGSFVASSASAGDLFEWIRDVLKITNVEKQIREDEEQRDLFALAQTRQKRESQWNGGPDLTAAQSPGCGGKTPQLKSAVQSPRSKNTKQRLSDDERKALFRKLKAMDPQDPNYLKLLRENYDNLWFDSWLDLVFRLERAAPLVIEMATEAKESLDPWSGNRWQMVLEASHREDDLSQISDYLLGGSKPFGEHDEWMVGVQLVRVVSDRALAGEVSEKTLMKVFEGLKDKPEFLARFTQAMRDGPETLSGKVFQQYFPMILENAKFDDYQWPLAGVHEGFVGLSKAYQAKIDEGLRTFWTKTKVPISDRWMDQRMEMAEQAVRWTRYSTDRGLKGQIKWDLLRTFERPEFPEDYLKWRSHPENRIPDVIWILREMRGWDITSDDEKARIDAIIDRVEK